MARTQEITNRRRAPKRGTSNEWTTKYVKGHPKGEERRDKEEGKPMEGMVRNKGQPMAVEVNNVRTANETRAKEQGNS